MSKAGHTPGPWQQSIGIVEVKLPGMVEFATFISIEADGFSAGGGICLVHEKHSGIGQANARLIAAAPELLEALIGLREELSMHQFPKTDDERRTNARIIKAEVAIAKATDK